MEINASFGRRGTTERSTSHVLSFSTSVLLFRGFTMQISLPFGYWCFVRKEEWSCFVDQLSVALFPPLSFTQLSLPWTALPREGEKRERKINREAQSDPIVSVRFSFKAFEETHLSVGGMRPNCSQSLLILPVQSPHRAGGGGGGVPWLGRYRHLALTFCLRLCPLKVGLFSLSHSEARRRATVWLTTKPLWYLY